MKCQAKSLDEVIQKAVRFVPRMTTMEALKYFEFSGTTVQASSMHLGALLSLPEGLNFETRTHVGAETFASIAKKLSGEITITLTEKTMKISDATSSFKLALLSPEQFPTFPTCKAKYVKAPFVHPAVDAVKEFTMDPTNTRIETGVCLSDDVAVATDGKVLAIAKLGANTKFNDVLGPNVIGNFWNELDSEIATDGGLVFVKSKSGVIFGNTMEGKFINHTSFTNQWKFPVVASLKLEDLRKELPKIGIIGKDKLNDITSAICTLQKKVLKMETTNSSGYVSVEIPVQCNGESKFRINVQLLDKWMHKIHSEEAKMSCASGIIGESGHPLSDTPIRFEGITADDANDVSVFTAYIMPMTLDVGRGGQNESSDTRDP